jgi:RNA polymerase sigma-70 factor (ECF subfamily)
MLAEGRARWPDIEVDERVFARQVERHVAEGGALEDLVGADLFLTIACLEGNARAIETLDAELLVPAVARAATRYRDLERAELEQNVREHLLVARNADGPKLASYAGRGPLEGWLRIVAVRSAISMLRRQRTDSADVDEALADVLTDDVELAYVRAEHASDFKAAFHEALAALSEQDSAVLRLYVVDDLTIDDIGRLYGVHRATAARWVGRIRASLFEETRRRLAARLGLDEQEFESLVGVLLSRLEVSLTRVLSPQEPARSED